MHGINASSTLVNQHTQQFATGPQGRGLGSVGTSSSHISSESYTSTSRSGVTVSISESSRILQKSVTQSTQVAAPVGVQRQTSAQTAENILTPIRDKLASAKENGASDKELRSLLREGYKGFKQGFREAFKTLAHAGSLDPSLKEDLKETKHLVRLGFSELRQEFAPKGNYGADSLEKAGVQTTELDADAVLNRTIASSPNSEISTRQSSVEHVSFKNEKFSQTFAEAGRTSRSVSIEQTRAALIEVRTNDGDVVTLDLASIIQAKKHADVSGVKYSYDTAETSGYVVQGTLDEGELKALDKLLDQVDVLAIQFFDGDVGSAFESALSLGFDTEEIASFSVALSESATVNLASSYLSNSRGSYPGARSTDSLQSAEQISKESAQKSSRETSQQRGYRHLGDYVTSLRQAVQTAEAFSQSTNLVSTLLSTRVELFEASYTEQQSISLTDLQGFNNANDRLLGSIL